MKPYEALFESGKQIRVLDRGFLENFVSSWKLHNPLVPEQIDFARKIATIKSVGFYHGGDPLYVLENIPGVWHEQCLSALN